MAHQVLNHVAGCQPPPVKSAWSLVCLALLGGIAFISAAPASATGDANEIDVYALDGGNFTLKDMGEFSDTGEYNGKRGALADPCFLIRHPKGTLLWDTGLGDKLAEKKNGLDDDGYHLSVPIPLAAQMKKIGLTPNDVTYVAFSHFHFDHTGNANLFGSSTWIINKAELKWALSKPTPGGVELKTLSAYTTVKTRMIEGDYDVFGDGNVRNEDLRRNCKDASLSQAAE